MNALTLLDTVAHWAKLLGDEMAEVDMFVWCAEIDWRHYQNTPHLTEPECRSKTWYQPKAPPKFPRPSVFEIISAYERSASASAGT